MDRVTFDQLVRALQAVCPSGTVGEDNDGQIVFYTNRRIETDGDQRFVSELSDPFDG